jgi:HEAT repeat protein
MALGVFRVEAKTIVPILIQMVKTEAGRLQSDSHVLSPNSVQSNYYGMGRFVLGRNDQGGDQVRIAAIQALGAFGAAGGAAVPELVRVFRADKDARVRWFTAGAIASLGPGAKEAVPALVGALRSNEVATGGPVSHWIGGESKEDEPIRLAAAVALGAIGPGARDAVPELTRALSDTDARVRAEAAAALGAIGTGAAAAVAQLARLSVEESDDRVADLACKALAGIGELAILDLTRIVRGANSDARVRAVSALGGIGSRAFVAIPDLMRALIDRDEDIRTAAALALGKIGNGPEAAVVVPGLIDALKDSDRHVRQQAAEGLGKIGPRTDRIIPALSGAMRDMDRDVRYAASSALERIGMPAFPALQALLRDDDSDVRDDAALALSRLATVEGYNRAEGETADQARARTKAARSALFAAIKGPDERTRTGASRALGYVGKDIIPELIAALSDTSPLVRLHVVRALAVIGSEASPALASLRERLRDPDPDVRGAAQATIKAILEPEPSSGD